MYADSRYYREYQSLLVQLHLLISQQAGDSPEAIELRQAMEEPEQHLSQQEMIRLNALSGDLSMMHDREIVDLDVVSRTVPAELPQLLMSAHVQKNWEELLALLRADVSQFLIPEQVAYWRSRAYEALDEFVPAVTFIDEAIRQAPTSANYCALAMELLWQDERYDEAYDRAKSYLADPKTPSRLVLMAGGIVSRRAQQGHAPVDMSVVITRSIERMERALPDENSPAILFAGYGILGLLAARVGDETKAKSALKKAIDIQVAIGIQGATEKQVAARGLLLAELELIQGGQMQSPEERALARQLADILPPDRHAVAA